MSYGEAATSLPTLARKDSPARASADIIEDVRPPSITKRYSSFGESEVLPPSPGTVSGGSDSPPEKSTASLERSTYEPELSKTPSRQSMKQAKHSEDLNTPLKQPRFRVERLKFKEDYRARLPILIARFTGYRSPTDEPPYEPLPFPPFIWLHKLPLRYEVWIFGWTGAFISMLLIEAIMSANTAFQDIYHAPIIVTSFGASAVLVFGVIESPLAQPRNFVLGHFVSALAGTAITRLFVLNASYRSYLGNTAFHGNVFVNGALSMAFSLLAQDVVGALHPPAGATGLNAAVEPGVVYLSWRYLPTVLASSLIMLGWALLINNLGRRRYPIYWWAPESTLVAASGHPEDTSEEAHLKELEEGNLRKAEDGARQTQGLLFESLAGEGGKIEDIEAARDEDGRDEPENVITEPQGKEMSEGDRERAEGRRPSMT